MIWVDIAIIALLAIYSLVGIARGFSQEGYSILVWVIGMFVAWFFSLDFAILLVKYIATPSTRLAIAFIVLVIITLTLGGIINMLLRGGAAKSRLTIISRLGGLLLGCGHGLVVALALVIAAGLTALPKDRWWQESKYLPPFQAMAVLIKESMSSKIARSINYR
jgi:membrane protein required for colicin V production